MRSLRWRMIAALATVIVFAWTVSLAMFISFIHDGQTNRWKTTLHNLGIALVAALPDGMIPADRDASPTTEPGEPGPVAARTATVEAASILTAMVLNTAELVLVGLLSWWALKAALRPLRSVSSDLTGRDPYDTAPVDIRNVPRELRPLLLAFNSLLGRVDTAMKAERQFIADAAHELRTPLAALHVQAEVALAATSMEARNEALGKLLDVSQRAQRLTEQLLDLARLDAGLHAAAMAEADLLELARHVLDEFRLHAADKAIRLRLAGESCRLRCDVDEMGVLIRNLVDNALRHGRPGGTVLVSCGWQREGGQRCAALSVSDDGVGVAEEELGAIFERFYRSPGTTTSGTGIGLSLVSGIAALHGASVEARSSTALGGLEVRLMFPASGRDILIES